MKKRLNQYSDKKAEMLWKTANKKPVKNKELWILLDEAITSHSIDWQWIKGHSGHPQNERADELANLVIEKEGAF